MNLLLLLSATHLPQPCTKLTCLFAISTFDFDLRAATAADVSMSLLMRVQAERADSRTYSKAASVLATTTAADRRTPSKATMGATVP